MSAWAFAVAAWARPGVEAICLDLQNVHGQSPALLLWRWRTLVENRAVEPDRLAAAVVITRGWEVEVLRPLRAIRRRLTAQSAPLAETARATVRRRVLDTELEAERALIEALEALETPEAGETPKTGETQGAGGVTSRLEAMLDLAEAWRSPAPFAAVARLIEAL